MWVLAAREMRARAPGLCSVVMFGGDADLAVGRQDRGVHGDERVGLTDASTLSLG